MDSFTYDMSGRYNIKLTEFDLSYGTMNPLISFGFHQRAALGESTSDIKLIQIMSRNLKYSKNLESLLFTFVYNYKVKKDISIAVSSFNFRVLFSLHKLKVLKLVTDNFTNHQKKIIWCYVKDAKQLEHLTLQLYYEDVSFKPNFIGNELVNKNLEVNLYATKVNAKEFLNELFILIKIGIKIKDLQTKFKDMNKNLKTEIKYVLAKVLSFNETFPLKLFSNQYRLSLPKLYPELDTYLSNHVFK